MRVWTRIIIGRTPMDQGCARGGSGWEQTPLGQGKALPGRAECG
ncbi:hypothetical protein C4J84_4101 [Pseudomonas sp. R11-23-07]|nr:hypothetical protein C4J84_4101 [Pseudomonas sp. R11-23-07]